MMNDFLCFRFLGDFPKTYNPFLFHWGKKKKGDETYRLFIFVYKNMNVWLGASMFFV